MEDPSDDPPHPSTRPAVSEAPADPVPPTASRLAWATATALREGDLDAAQRACEEALRSAHTQPHGAGVASVQTILGRILRMRGELEASDRLLTDALRVQRSHGADRPIAHTLLEIGAVRAQRGELAAAQSAFMDALTRFARTESHGAEASAQLGIAAVHHADGHLTAARRHAEVALGVARSLRDAALEASCHEALAAVDHEAGRRLRARNGYRAAQACWEQARDRPGIARCHIGLSRLALDEDLSIHPILERLEQDKAVQRQPWLMGQVACLRGVLLGRAGDRLAYSVLAHAAALLDGHPAWRHLPAIDQGHLDLQRGDESAAYGRLGAVPNEALYAVPVRLALGTLRHSLGAALRATSA